MFFDTVWSSLPAVVNSPRVAGIHWTVSCRTVLIRRHWMFICLTDWRTSVSALAAIGPLCSVKMRYRNWHLLTWIFKSELIVNEYDMMEIPQNTWPDWTLTHILLKLLLPPPSSRCVQQGSRRSVLVMHHSWHRDQLCTLPINAYTDTIHSTNE